MSPRLKIAPRPLRFRAAIAAFLLALALLPPLAAAPAVTIPEGAYYFLTVPAKQDRRSPLFVPHVVEVIVGSSEGRYFISIPGAKEALSYEIRTEGNGILITIPQPPYSPFGLSTGVYSATATVGNAGETPERFDGKYWIVGGYGDDAEAGLFSLISKPK